jgi:hypothetical protein
MLWGCWVCGVIFRRARGWEEGEATEGERWSKREGEEERRKEGSGSKRMGGRGQKNEIITLPRFCVLPQDDTRLVGSPAMASIINSNLGSDPWAVQGWA